MTRLMQDERMVGFDLGLTLLALVSVITPVLRLGQPAALEAHLGPTQPATA